MNREPLPLPLAALVGLILGFGFILAAIISPRLGAITLGAVLTLIALKTCKILLS